MAKDEPFIGGPLDGIYVGPLVRVRNGQTELGLKPSKPDASPLPAKLGPAIHGILNAYETSDTDRQRSFLARDAKGQLCPEGVTRECGPIGPLFQDQFKEHCAHNTPYYMANTDEVRIEWLCNGELWYISYLRVLNGKISNVRTAVAYAPQRVRVKQ